MNKWWIKPALFSILSALVVNFIIYNYNLVVYYAFGAVVLPLQYHAIIRYGAYFVLAALMPIRKEPMLGRCLILLAPAILIDATTLVNGPDLIPLRFPYDTLYPIFGVFTAYAMYKSRLHFTWAITGSIIFIVTGQYIIRPAILLFRHQNNQPPVVQNDLLRLSFLSKDSLPLLLSDTLRGSPAVVEFYFVGCSPCEQKVPSLLEIHRTYAPKGLKTVFICNGNANSFEVYRNYAQKFEDLGIVCLYDATEAAASIGVNGYPMEFICVGDSLVWAYSGFMQAHKTQWLLDEIARINKILPDE